MFDFSSRQLNDKQLPATGNPILEIPENHRQAFFFLGGFADVVFERNVYALMYCKVEQI